jgi:hypothetical protein
VDGVLQEHFRCLIDLAMGFKQVKGIASTPLGSIAYSVVFLSILPNLLLADFISSSTYIVIL